MNKPFNILVFLLVMGQLKNILLISLLATTSLVFGQEDDDYVLPKDSTKLSDKISTQVSLGTGVGMSGDGNYFMTFVRPTMFYDLSPKLALYSGIGYYNYQFNNFPVVGDMRYQPLSGNLSQLQAYVGAKYQITDRLAARAELFYNLYQNVPGMNNLTSGVNNFQRMGFAGALQYKLRDNLYFEAEFRMNDFNRTPGGNYNPMQNHGFGSGSFMRENSPVFFFPNN